MGRHREFDIDKALDAAVDVFWRKGYEGTSYADLTEATGVARPGLYAAFGDKMALFVKVLDRYEEHQHAFVGEAMEQPDVRGVVKALLLGAVEAFTGRETPAGCLGVNGALACSDASSAVRDVLIDRRRRLETALCQRFETARSEGDLPPGFDPVVLARMICALVLGLAVQAKSGTGGDQLRDSVDAFLMLWPA